MTDYCLSRWYADRAASVLDLAERLHLPAMLERHLGSHGLHRGVSNGWLATAWMACMVSGQDHRKSGVRLWAEQHREVLGRLLPDPIRSVEFSDARLGIVLRRLTHTQTWEELEQELWECVRRARPEKVTGVRFEGALLSTGGDRTTGSAPLHLVLAAAQPSGQALACEVAQPQLESVSGLSLIRRVRAMLGRAGILYAGNGAISDLSARADIVAHGDAYLVGFPPEQELAADGSSGPTVVSRRHLARPVHLDGRMLGVGYEFGRPVSAEMPAQRVVWTERVQEICSPALSGQAAGELEARLVQAEAALWALTPPPGRGRRPLADEPALRDAVGHVLQQYGVEGLLDVSWSRDEKTVVRYVGPGRGGPLRPTRRETHVHLAITGVRRQEEAIERERGRAGWRVQATSLAPHALPFAQAVALCQDSCGADGGSSLFRESPLERALLYVRRDDQLIGLGRLLMLALWLRPWVQALAPSASETDDVDAALQKWGPIHKRGPRHDHRAGGPRPLPDGDGHDDGRQRGPIIRGLPR